MASKNKAGNSRSSSAGSRKDKHGSNKNGKKEDGPSGSSFFTWFMIIALLGVWSSVAVIWFDLVDYEDVLGKLGIYDADGDGDLDVEDAKILLGLKEVERPIFAELFGKNEKPVQPSVHTPIETEEPAEEGHEPAEEGHEPAEEGHEPAEEGHEPAEEGHEPAEEGQEPAEEQTNEFDVGAEDSEGPEAEDSEPEVVDVSEDKFSESEVREEEVDDDTVSDEAVLEPEEVVSEDDIPVYESDMEGDFSDHLDSEDEIEEDLPVSDEFIEDEDLEIEETVEEFYAEEPAYVPETDDIQEALPVQNGDEDDLPANGSQNLDVESEIQDAVPLPEAVEEAAEKDITLEATEEHPAEEEHVNYTEDYPEVSEPSESDPSESDHLEITDDPKEAIIAEPEISPSKDKLKETFSDL